MVLVVGIVFSGAGLSFLGLPGFPPLSFIIFLQLPWRRRWTNGGFVGRCTDDNKATDHRGPTT
eukprot:6456485-Amphidinium_carterae.1